MRDDDSTLFDDDHGMASNLGDDIADEVVAEEEREREGADRDSRVPLLQSPLRVVDEADVVSESLIKRKVDAINPDLNGDGVISPREARIARMRKALIRAHVHLHKAVRIILQIALIVAVCMAGERLADILPVDVPSNIVSMIVLLVFLMTGTLRMRNIADGANFLLDHMSIFFIPAAVAIMGSFSMIAPNIIKLVLICLITTVLVFFVTSFTVSTVMNLMARLDARKARAAIAGGDAQAAVRTDSKEGAR